MTRAKAHANIALMKYWGKADETLALPYTSSVSLTLDKLYTVTEVRRDAKLTADRFILNGVRQAPEETAKLTRFIDLFQAARPRLAIDSRNSFPTASGLASSASGYAALATALNSELGLHLDKPALSRLTRRGSGSAARSLYGGLAVWQTGDDQSSYAYSLDETLDLEMLIVIVDAARKPRSSRSLMKQTVEESAYFQAWVDESARDFPHMLTAIRQHDIPTIGRLAERNAMMMHGTLLAMREPFFYFQPQTLEVLQLVQDLRAEGHTAYYTMDAGPNVKILTDSTHRDTVHHALRERFPKLEIIAAQRGPEANVL